MYVAVEANSTASPRVIMANASSGLALPACVSRPTRCAPLGYPQLRLSSVWTGQDRYDFNFWQLSPVGELGWAVLGEASSKWVGVSNKRIVEMLDGSDGPQLRVRGAPNEVVGPPHDSDPNTVLGGQELFTVMDTYRKYARIMDNICGSRAQVVEFSFWHVHQKRRLTRTCTLSAEGSAAISVAEPGCK